MSNIILTNFQDYEINFQADGWLNATQAAAMFNKRPIDWLRLPETERYINKLCALKNISINNLVETNRGKRKGYTLFHADLLVKFARWLNADFGDWYDLQIRDLIKYEKIIEALKDFDFEENLPNRFIYVAQDNAGNIKIGISKNPEKRIKDLNIGNASELTLIYSREAIKQGYQDEIELHKKCASFNLRSEWFSVEALSLIQ